MSRCVVAFAAIIAGFCAVAGANPASAQIISPEVNGNLILASHSGNEWVYDLRVTGTSGYHFTIPANGEIEIFGMTDVTSAAVDGGLAGAFTASYTATTATFEANSQQQLVVSGTPYGEFDVFSTAPSPGTVNFSIDHTTGQLVGTTVDGPLAVIPEPSTWAMMALGVLALGFLGAQKQFDCHSDPTAAS